MPFSSSYYFVIHYFSFFLLSQVLHSQIYIFSKLMYFTFWRFPFNLSKIDSVWNVVQPYFETLKMVISYKKRIWYVYNSLIASLLFSQKNKINLYYMNETIIRNKKNYKNFIPFYFIWIYSWLPPFTFSFIFFFVNDFIILRVFQHEIKNCTKYIFVADIFQCF